MDEVLIIEKSTSCEFPAHEPEHVLFKQGNKAIMWRENKKTGDKTIGYISLPLRSISVKLQKESSKNFLKLKSNFYLPTNIKVEWKDSPIFLCLYSMTVKHNGDWFYFGFCFQFKNKKRFNYFNGDVGIGEFLNTLKAAEQKILNYE